MKYLILYLALSLSSCVSSVKNQRKITSVSQIDGYWTQVRSGCDLDLSLDEVQLSYKKKKEQALSSGILSLFNGKFKSSLGNGRACDPNSPLVDQYIEEYGRDAYCGGELVNAGKFTLIQGNKYYFDGKYIKRFPGLASGTGVSIKEYEIFKMTDFILKMTYNYSRCPGKMTIYYIAIPN